MSERRDAAQANLMRLVNKVQELQTKHGAWEDYQLARELATHALEVLERIDREEQGWQPPMEAAG